MKKYKNLYAGWNEKYLVGGIDLDKLGNAHDLDIVDGKQKVGFINKDILLQACKDKEKQKER